MTRRSGLGLTPPPTLAVRDIRPGHIVRLPTSGIFRVVSARWIRARGYELRFVDGTSIVLDRYTPLTVLNADASA